MRVLEGWDPEPFPLFVVYPRNRHLSARVRAFVDWAIERYAGIVTNLELRLLLPTEGQRQ